jgi:dTDP-4-amino-4,6-dideoxygalactose transaminase
MKRIHELSVEYGFAVIEDASHAVGGSYMGDRVGSGTYSSGVVFSFHPVKIMTTGEGGVFVTNRDDLADRVRLLRSHGITRVPGQLSGTPHGPWYYEQQELGYNYRMTDIQAALGESQLKRVDDFVARRNEIADRYSALMTDLPVRLPRVAEGIRSTFHLFVIRLKLEEIKVTQRQVFEALHNAGVIVSLHYIPVYLQPYYRGLGFSAGHCPEAEKYYSQVLTLPLYVELTPEQQRTVVEELSRALRVS